MFARGKLVGVIDIQSTRLNAFSDSDTALLRLIAARVSASIDNARLHRRVLTQNRTSRILAQLSNEFSSILQLNELLTKIAKAIRTLINYDAFSILLVDLRELLSFATVLASDTISASTSTISRSGRESPAQRRSSAKSSVSMTF